MYVQENISSTSRARLKLKFVGSTAWRVCNVKSMGANGDGETDDTAALRKALAACDKVPQWYIGPTGSLPVRALPHRAPQPDFESSASHKSQRNSSQDEPNGLPRHRSPAILRCVPVRYTVR